MPPALSIRLSEALPSCLPHCDETRVSVVERFVNQIDFLPEPYASRFRGITALHLSNNCLADLRGVGQFPLLRSLSLANNMLRSFAALRPLSQLKHLTHLNLQYNPVALQ
eukprot:gene7143-6757_t